MTDRWHITVVGPIVRRAGVPKPGWLNDNDRMHFHARNRIVQQWKANTRFACRVAGLRRMERARIDIVFVVPHARRDTNNLNPTAKAIVDGIRDNREKVGRHWIKVPGWLPDDDAAHLDGPHMDLRVEPGIQRPTVEVTITPLEGDCTDGNRTTD